MCDHSNYENSLLKHIMAVLASMASVAHLWVKHSSFELAWETYEWLLRLNINFFIIIYTCCSAEIMARKHADRLMQKLESDWYQTDLLLLYRRKCKFNYWFVYVSSPKVKLRNLNGNRKLICLFTYLCSLQIQAATGAMWGWSSPIILSYLSHYYLMTVFIIHHPLSYQ